MAQVVLTNKKDGVSAVTGEGSGGGGDNINNYNTLLGVPLGVYGRGRFGGHCSLPCCKMRHDQSGCTNYFRANDGNKLTIQ